MEVGSDLEETPRSGVSLLTTWLKAKGFSLLSVMDPEEWPNSLRLQFRSLNIGLPKECRIVLIGSVGSELWEIIRKNHWIETDPIDTYTIKTVEELRERKWRHAKIDWLYPGTLPVPLQQLSRQAGWSHPSLLGLDISPKFGTWFACRAAFVLDLNIECTFKMETESPCDACVKKPCRPKCPAGAVRNIDKFGLDECGSYRILDGSPCNYQCMSRLSCPVGSSWRYTNEQMDYHGKIALTGLKNFYS